MKRRRPKSYEVSLPKVNWTKFGIAILCLVLAYFFITNSIVRYYIVKRNYKILKEKLNKLKEENLKLQHEIQLLQTDKDTIEYYIRKELNYKKPKEKILILKNNTSTKK